MVDPIQTDQFNLLNRFNDYFVTHEESAKYKSLLDEMSEPVIIEDKNFDIIYANPGFTKLVCSKPAECIGRSVFDFFNESNKKHYIKEVEKGLRGDTPERPIEVNSKSGNMVPVLIGATKVFNDCRMITMTDISKIGSLHKKYKEESEKYFSLLQDSYRETGTVKRKLDYLNDLINFMAVDMPDDDLNTLIANSVSAFMKADACVIRLYDTDRNKFFVKYTMGAGPEWNNKKPLAYKGSLVEKAIKEGGILIVEDIQKENIYSSPDLARKNGFVSVVIVPLGVKGHLAGYVSSYFKDKSKLKNLDTEFLLMYLKQAAIALQ
ncbi:MAG: hypothetical protein US89_C0012G0028 [Candidatus Peregrinibacteria bacterium GW2011_GWF2_38_29]|nr:MAG: hypothetical protein US89_C0012G0028 [Candidatus Peregrinibacteria bacterium GW2011_GWF2_38_29]HBB02468.1 hypothetical protein [Candidatus Peregrinibacteria bacterium]